MSSSEDAAYRALMDCAHGFMVSQVLFAACELRLFDALAEAPAPLDVTSVAAHVDSSAWAAELLLDVCVRLGLLRRDSLGAESRPGVRGIPDRQCSRLSQELKPSAFFHFLLGTRARYSNSELSSTFLVSTGTQSQHHLLLYLAGTPYRCWGYLAQAVREGRNQYPDVLGVMSHEPFAAIYRSEAERLRFMRGLQAVWSVCGRRVMAAFDLTPFRVICDVGGGSGALAKHCASLYPGSRVIVFDFPEVVNTARTHFLFHQEERIEFCAGDFFQDPLPAAELYILARVLHDWSDAQCSRLLARIHQACAPGGGVLVVESVLDEDGHGPLPVLLYSLNMLVQTEGRERTVSQYRALVASAGFPGSSGRRPGVSMTLC